MSQDNKIPQEPIEAQLLMKETPELNGRGRPSIEEDDDLKIKYITIHRLKVTNPTATLQSIANVAKVSVGTVKNALRYVRSNWEVLGSQEGLADCMAIVDERIAEVNIILEKLNRGTPILMPDGVTALLETDGSGNIIYDKNNNPKVATKMQHDLILRYRRDRKEYEILRMDLMGLLKKTDMLIANSSVINNVNIQQNIAIVDKMSKEDKELYLGMLEKYAQPPDSDS